jgi:divalent metal cation (Fe/Co/Zn/Cd) transporter
LMNENGVKPAKLLRQGLLLEYATLGWNVVGVCITIFAALRAHSVALAGFGLDSVIEIGASMVVIWQLTGAGKDRQKRALHLIGTAFFALAVYILGQSSRTLYLHLRPAPSLLGIAWLGLTFVAMLALAFGKHRVGTQLNNPVLRTEGRVTLVDAYLASAILMGLVLNAILGWWWADPLASLVIVFYGCKEGVHAWAENAESVQAY